jgi:LacI family transcriptional regulator
VLPISEIDLHDKIDLAHIVAIPLLAKSFLNNADMNEIQRRRVTLVDIAADAGVSRATASLVIRNVPSVAESTRKRVLRSIKRLGYVYHSGAANLRTQQSNAVGLIVSDITNPFFAEASVAIEERLAAANYVTLLGNTSEDRTKEDRVLKTMREFPAQGILICPALERNASEGASALAGRLPIVSFARRAPGIDYAWVDNAQGALLAVEHLYQLGHQRIAFIVGNPNSSAGQERMEGYKKALTRSALRFNPRLVIPSAPTRRGGYDSVQQLLQIEDRPTAALCFNDVVALGVLEAIGLAGRKAGAGFGVIGFNNIPDAAYSFPGLTTVDTSPALLGEMAAELLLKRIEQPDSPTRTVILQPRLIVRESCGTTN